MLMHKRLAFEEDRRYKGCQRANLAQI